MGLRSLPFFKAKKGWQFAGGGLSADAVGKAEYHIYTPSEHQVAWWEEEIDGVWKRKPVYEVIINGLVTQSSNYIYDLTTNYDSEDIIDIQGMVYGTNAFIPVNCPLDMRGGADTFCSLFAEYASSKWQLKSTASANLIGRSMVVIVKYTKTTDQWQNF